MPSSPDLRGLNAIISHRSLRIAIPPIGNFADFKYSDIRTGTVADKEEVDVFPNVLY